MQDKIVKDIVHEYRTIRGVIDQLRAKATKAAEQSKEITTELQYKTKVAGDLRQLLVKTYGVDPDEPDQGPAGALPSTPAHPSTKKD